MSGRQGGGFSEAVANDEVHISEPRKHRALFNKLTANAQCSIFARSVIIIFKVRKKYLNGVNNTLY